MLGRSILRASRNVAIDSTSSTRLSSIPLSSRLSAVNAASRLRTAPNALLAFSRAAQGHWRLYSSEAASEKKTEATEEGKSEKSESSEVDTLKKQLEAKEKELAVMKDNYLRSIADYRNIQERTKRETQNARDFALSSVMKDVLASLDNFEHALAAVPEEKLVAPSSDATVESLHADIKGFHEGVQLTERALLETLAKHGLKKLDPAMEKEKFDPNRHNALFTGPAEGLENGVVSYTQQKGYELNGRVIRAAQVGVVKNP